MLQNIVQEYILDLYFLYRDSSRCIDAKLCRFIISLDSSLSIVFTAIDSISVQSSTVSHICVFYFVISITRVELDRFNSKELMPFFLAIGLAVNSGTSLCFLPIDLAPAPCHLLPIYQLVFVSRYVGHPDSLYISSNSIVLIFLLSRFYFFIPI
jgi:hypothetical protein